MLLGYRGGAWSGGNNLADVEVLAGMHERAALNYTNVETTIY